MFDAEKSTQNAVDTFSRVAAECKTFDEVINHLETALKAFSVTGFGYWSFPRSVMNAKSGELNLDDPSYVLAFRGPTYLKAVENIYFKNQMFQNDPTLSASSLATTPLSTFDIFQTQKRSLIGNAVHGLMNKLGICRDLYIPIHTPLRIQVLWIFSLTGPKGTFEAETPLLQLLADRFAVAIADFVELKNSDSLSTNPLTTRESQCVLLMSRGYSNKEIALELEISVHAVKFHATNLMQTLDAANRSQVIARAAKAGWLIY